MPPAHPNEAPVGEEYLVYQLDLIKPSDYHSPVGDVMDWGAFCESPEVMLTARTRYGV